MAEPTITDEELADRHFSQHRTTDPIGNPRRRYCRSCNHFWPCPTARLIAALRDARQRLDTVRALHPRGPGNLCPRCRVDWPCETAEGVGE